MKNLKKKIIIAEIGLNHLGSEQNAKKYLSNLCNSRIHGISFQIKKKSFYEKFRLALKKKDKNFSKNFRDNFFTDTLKNKKIKKLSLSNKFYKYAIQKCKKKKKLIGFAIQDEKKINFLRSQQIDFYKILNEDINNIKLIKKIRLDKKAFKIISTSNNSIKQIKKTIKILGQKNKTIVTVTQFSKKIKPSTLTKIKKYRDIFDVKVGYGNHSEVQSIKRILKYKLDVLLFYVKLDGVNSYPDNSHAINLYSKIKDLYL